MSTKKCITLLLNMMLLSSIFRLKFGQLRFVIEKLSFIMFSLCVEMFFNTISVFIKYVHILLQVLQKLNFYLKI